MFWHKQLYMSWYIRSFFGFTILNSLYFFKYSSTNIFHRRSLYTFYYNECNYSCMLHGIKVNHCQERDPWPHHLQRVAACWIQLLLYTYVSLPIPILIWLPALRLHDVLPKSYIFIYTHRLHMIYINWNNIQFQFCNYMLLTTREE